MIIPAYLDCKHRGPRIAQREARCSGMIDVFECQLATIGGETVLRKAGCDLGQRNCQSCPSLERRDGRGSLLAELNPAAPPRARTADERAQRRELVATGQIVVALPDEAKRLRRIRALRRPQAGGIRWISSAQLTRDVPRLIAQLPPDLAGVAGVVRSGMGPAWQLATLLHLPLYEFRQQTGELRPLGHGYRGTGRKAGPVLIIDDTIAGGRTMRDCQKRFRGEAIWACIYTVRADLARELGALFVEETGAHFLEWNVFNNGPLRRCGTDLDGILCYDPPMPDRDVAAYEAWLPNAAPRWLARKVPLPLIVTARLEKYRPQTEAWLRRWSVAWETLIMHPASDFRERGDVAAWKARVLADQAQVINFLESSEGLARRIAGMWDGRVICPDAETVF